MTDTFLRSCKHWSEANRTEMEAFYTLASIDYKYLAEAFDWKKWLETLQNDVGNRKLKILDVACGSGKFPLALNQYSQISEAKISPVEYSLLDPSSFSISETRKVLPPPFIASNEFETTLQEFKCVRDCFDIVWATHALYAVPKNQLEIALKRFVYGMCKVGFIAHATDNSHYLRFYNHYLEGFKGGLGEQYSSAKQIIQILTKLDIPYRVEKISYENCVPEGSLSQVEGYLQRCVFDDTINLDAMRKNISTGPYLDNCLDNGKWHFNQEVMLIFLSKA